MKRVFFIVLTVTACGSTGGGSEALVEDTVLTISHQEGTDPRGYLQVQSGGSWLYGNSEACKHTQGSVPGDKLAEIERWVNDDSLKPYVTRDSCATTDYIVSGSAVRMCWPQDKIPDTDSARSLTALFEEYSGKLKWDGIKRECNMPNLTAQPSGMTPQTDPPPPSRGAAGSGD